MLWSRITQTLIRFTQKFIALHQSLKSPSIHRLIKIIHKQKLIPARKMNCFLSNILLSVLKIVFQQYQTNYFLSNMFLSMLKIVFQQHHRLTNKTNCSLCWRLCFINIIDSSLVNFKARITLILANLTRMLIQWV